VSHYSYLEDQLQKLEIVNKKQVVRIEDNTSSITEERLVRNDADKALAQFVTTASVGASRVYTQSSPPVATGRLQGDVWYDTDDSFKPYVWYASAWQDNSTGNYTQYVGQIATISTTLGSTKDKVDNTLGVQWAVKANINGSTGGLTFTGIQKADGTGATYNLEINSNVTINGGLIVAGSLGSTQIADGAITTGKIAAGTITGDRIAAGTITGTNIAAGSINADRISAGTITADRIVAGSIETTRLADGAVSNAKIANSAVNTSKISSNSVTYSGYGSGTASCSTTVTVRSGARVQIIAVAKASSTTQSKEWYSTGGNGSSPQYWNGSAWASGYPPAPSTAVSSLGSLTINTPGGSESSDILGAYNGSSSDSARGGSYYVNGNWEYGYYRNYTIMAYATTTITSYYNGSGSDISYNFSVSASGVNTTVSLYVIEMAR
jgi:hypothetical protein